MSSGSPGPPHSPDPKQRSPFIVHRKTFPGHLETESSNPTPPTLNTAKPQTTQSKHGADSPTSVSSDSRFDQLNTSAADRIFPIRSVVSVDPSVTTPNRSEGAAAHGCGSISSRTSGHDVRPPSLMATLRQNSVHNAYSIPQPPGAPRPSSQPRRSLDSHISAGSENLWRKSPASESFTAGGSPSANESRKKMDGSPESPTSVDGSMSRSNSIVNAEREMGPTNVDLPQNSSIGPERRMITSRFQHVVTDEGHAVIAGRDGKALRRCEDEPIHIPGAVQSFGLLIALREEDDEKLSVRVVSENSKRLIGYTPSELFALDSFCDILSEEQMANLLDHLDFIRDAAADPALNGPEVFTLAIRSPGKRTTKMWCAMHINEKNPDLVICEFELEDDHLNPLVHVGDATPEPPEDTLQSNPSAEEFAESTIISSKPLRVLRNARRRKGDAAVMEVFNIMSQVQEQLASAPNLEMFLKVLVGVIKELTGFHRVMIYQFDQAWNGRVVTELVDPRATKDLYKGLNFPASDIPQQARDLYKVNKVRLLYDRDQLTARLVCRSIEDLETPLDLTFAYLRAMSPIHIKYLANMGVRASMSISMTAFDELWGLIACHSYGSKGMRVSFPIRKMCRLVGDSASRNIERLSYANRLQARKLINTIPTQGKPSGYIMASSHDLLDLFDADCGLLSIRDETKILGELEQTHEALAMLEYLRLRKITSVTTSTDIREDFPDLRYPPGFTVIVGLLHVPLSAGGHDFIVFFRKGQTREVKWAGNPYEKFVKEGIEGCLEPRTSFRAWSEIIDGKCREWTETQMESAAVLCLVYGKFIEVWRQKEAALQSSQLTKLLLANSAHEFRTPLNAIINYLEIAMEGQIDPDTRENLMKSHSASKSLIYVINDLLDLTKTEESQKLLKAEVFDLPGCVREAAEMFESDAKRKQLEYKIIDSPDVPRFVIGDQRRLRQAISNMVANAIQYTFEGAVKVELELTEHAEDRIEVEIVIQDTGVGMSPEKLDCLFRDLEQVQSATEDELQQQIVPDHAPSEKNHNHRTLGLGLAIVARIIRNMNGRLRLKSEEDKGSRFVIQLSFELPDTDRPQILLTGPQAAGISVFNQPSTPPFEKGEILLVDKSPHKASPLANSRNITHRKSNDSMNSLKSTATMKSFKSGSSAKSDVDRLISAIQEPHMVRQNLTDADTSLQKSGGNRPNLPPRRSSTFSRTISSLMSSPVPPEGPAPGESLVEGSKTPIKSVRIPPEFGRRNPGPVSFDIPHETIQPPISMISPELHVLVAEDDPINSKIVKKRLEKQGHSVHLTVNGEECSSAYGEKPESFDVILMDMQMPIVDGLASTKMIRSFEKSHPMIEYSGRATLNGRVPVFAVSASLVERDCHLYVQAGFDGWILKPVDFHRLNELFTGIVEENTRESCLYTPGKWERGGWFGRRDGDMFSTTTITPSGRAHRSMVSSLGPSSLLSEEDRSCEELDGFNRAEADLTRGLDRVLHKRKSSDEA